MSINDKILDAIELLADNSVKKAGYDKTIQAQVLSCQDATIGKYRCRYQDAIIYAYTNNTDITYTNGAYVYILVPGSDMNKEKTILGTTNKLGINYISQVQGDQAYDVIGTNPITLNETLYLNTLNKNYKYILTADDINLDEEALRRYIQVSSSLIAGATFKTSIPPERQLRGHYGITYNLRFLDNTSNQQVVRSYTIDQDNMIDNPYRLIYGTRQYQIFDVDGVNFIGLESIEIFNKDFPNAVGQIKEERLTTGDIEITALQLNAGNRMSENEIGGIAISFYTPQGTFFTESSTSASCKTITAQVRIKGKLVSDAQKIPFYWGIQNVGISNNSQYYNKYLGRGWKCLNDSNIIDADEAIVQWVPSGATYILNFDDATARDNKLKVAIVYDGNVVTKTINIQNLGASIPILTIESDKGTKFYYDIGHPTLTCKVNDGQPVGYSYSWAYESNTGVLEQLPETTDQNIQYENAVADLASLQAEVAAGTKFKNAEADNLRNLESKIKEFDFIQRVDGNKIYDIQINKITNFGTFKCSVYNDQDIYLGTAAITLTNTLEGEDLYSLVINNGSAVFQYNENGVAPNNKSLDVPQQLQVLSFTIYDNLGEPIDSSIIANEKNCKIRWQFPIEETMLVEQSENEPNAGTNAEQTYKYYDNKPSLIYGISQKYDIKKQRNQIKLTVDYKGMNLTAETDFTFTKQGEPGTNGTEFLVKLIPNTQMDNPPLYPMITKAGSEYVLNYGLNSPADETVITTGGNYQLFKAQLWHSGDLVWEGVSAETAAIDGFTKPSLVMWEVLKNKYNASTEDASAFEVTDGLNGRIQYTGDHLERGLDSPLANIIKCSINWQGKTYYGTIPIVTAWTRQSYYRVSLQDYSGFRYVIYSSDGMTPQYDSSHPFEFICKEKINEQWEDISVVEGSHAVEYEVSAVGNYLSTKDGSATDSNLLEILTNEAYRKDCAKNQFRARPASRYDGTSVNVAICCIYTQNNGIIIGRINVPIHYLLNKYGMANINEWDGNSVQLDADGGFILSPQIGAGHKESDNSFTGVLMGETREPGKSVEQIGLLGYNSGKRSFFLNSKNGSALFGNSGQGQIIIDPSDSQKKAMLYSGNFWKNYNDDGDNIGLPTSYTYRDNGFKPAGNGKGEGLIIDLTTPQIYFGTGNFYVTKEGYVHAAAGGDIGGWKIGTDSLYSDVREADGRITLDATAAGKIYSHSHNTIDNTGKGFYLGHDGLSLGNKVKITDTGQMYVGNGAVAGTGKHWTIDGDNDKSYIAYGGDSWAQAEDDEGTAAKVYLGTDGISLGSRFSVNPQGELKAFSGQIGGWQITRSQLKSVDDNIVLSSNGSMSGGSDEDSTWQIEPSGKATFNNLIANKGGSIGGWAIRDGYLQSGSLRLNSDGSISHTGGKWSISKDGVATFSNTFNLTNTFHFSGTGSLTGGGSLSGSGARIGAGSSFINPNSVHTGANTNQTLKGYFDTLYAKKADIGDLNVLQKLTYKGYTAYWSPVVTDVSLTLIKDGNNVTGASLNKTRYYGIICGLRPPGR